MILLFEIYIYKILGLRCQESTAKNVLTFLLEKCIATEIVDAGWLIIRYEDVHDKS